MAVTCTPRTVLPAHVWDDTTHGAAATRRWRTYGAQVFRGRIGSLRKALKARCEFFFVDAPHLARGEEAELRAAGGAADRPRSWWNWEVGDLAAPPCHAARVLLEWP